MKSFVFYQRCSGCLLFSYLLNIPSADFSLFLLNQFVESESCAESSLLVDCIRSFARLSGTVSPLSAYGCTYIVFSLVDYLLLPFCFVYVKPSRLAFQLEPLTFVPLSAYTYSLSLPYHTSPPFVFSTPPPTSSRPYSPPRP